MKKKDPFTIKKKSKNEKKKKNLKKQTKDKDKKESERKAMNLFLGLFLFSHKSLVFGVLVKFSISMTHCIERQ